MAEVHSTHFIETAMLLLKLVSMRETKSGSRFLIVAELSLEGKLLRACSSPEVLVETQATKGKEPHRL